MQAFEKVRRAGLAIAGLALVTTLASCGGSDDNGNNPTPAPPVATNTPPTSASGSVGGFIAYLKTLTATVSDTTEPLDVANFVAPTDDTGPFDTTI